MEYPSPVFPQVPQEWPEYEEIPQGVPEQSQGTGWGGERLRLGSKVIKERNSETERHKSLHALCARNQNRREAGAVSVR